MSRPALVGIAAGLVLCGLADADGTGEYVVVGTPIFRAYAVSAALPKYPASSLSAGHEGRAVLRVLVSESGRPLSAQVLEAPDSAIASAAREAVLQWTFRPFVLHGRNSPSRAESRLVFYFQIVGGKPRVVDAASRLWAQTPRKEAK